MEKTTDFRRNLIVVLVVLQIITVSLILIISRVSHDRVLIDQARVQLENASQDALRHTQSYLTPALRTTLNTVDLFNQNNFVDKSNIEKYFLSQLENNQEFTGIYFATTAGDFYYVSRNTEKPASKYRTKDIFHVNDNKFTTVSWRDASLALVEPAELIDDPYSPLQRPWYISAIEKQDLIWSEPYVFFTSKKIGITIAKPYLQDGEIAGVIGIDIEISDLSDFLATLNLGESGNALIMNQSGEFIAISGEQNEYQRQDFQLSFANQAQQNLALQAAQTYKKNANKQSSQQEFSFNNTEYLAVCLPFNLSNNDQAWVLVTYAEQNSFLNKMRITERINVIIALSILFISVLVGYALTKKISAPVMSWHDQAITDQLTSVYNRRYLFSQGQRLYERAMQNKNENFALAIIDIDDFKIVNDDFGHAEGDDVLVGLVAIMREKLRPSDYIYRYGGEEFIIIFPQTNLDQAHDIMLRLQEYLSEKPLKTFHMSHDLTLSIGLGQADPMKQDQQFGDFIELVDKAMYLAKSSGKNTIQKVIS